MKRHTNLQPDLKNKKKKKRKEMKRRKKIYLTK